MAGIPVRSPTIVVLALADIPHGRCLADINIPPQISDIGEALGGIVEQLPGWFLEHEPEPQLAAHHRVVLGVIPKADKIAAASKI